MQQGSIYNLLQEINVQTLEALIKTKDAEDWKTSIDKVKDSGMNSQGPTY